MIIWLVSYPKSGNTWVRSFLSAYYFTENGNFEFELLDKIQQYPQKIFFEKKIKKPGEVSLYWNSSQEKLARRKKITFLKTHNSLNSINGNEFTSIKHTLGVIYIIRDPRNVITSLKNHYELNYEESLKFMTNERKYLQNSGEKDYADFHFLNSWSNHYKSWISTNLFKRFFIKYEDLEKNPHETFRKLILFVNSLQKNNEKINEKKINNCINSTSFEKLKEKERKSGFLEAAYSGTTNKKINFFNLGFDNKWKKAIPKKFHKKINTIFEKDIKFLGY